MISRVFIDRPIFAWVISIIIMMAGLGGLLTLPVEQYPDIAPASIQVRATYPGASAETLEASVTQVLEQQLSGIDGMIYFSSTSTSSGQVTINVTFDKGVDPDIAQVQVQNKVQQALPRLPAQVQQQGLRVTKSNPDALMVVALYDKTDRQTNADISDYIASNLQDPISRVPGVGDVNIFGAQYAMRIWLDPFKLASYGLIPGDVISAVQAQNTQVAAGQIGGRPSLPGQMLNVTVTARSRLTHAEQFREIIVKTQANGAKVLLSDVARVELGNEGYNVTSRLNGHPASGFAINLAPGADSLKTAKLVREELKRRTPSLPSGYVLDYPVDTTTFIKLSVEEVVKTLIEAIILVVIVMFVFLQSWRATLIPAIAVPVVMLGTFGILAAFGFSVNTLTLFGIVLSIGLLVDDAIVVVENVERVMAEEPDISPRDATIKSMGEIQTALIAIALVLSAVFLPMAMFGGSVGVIYRQFSITIVSSMLLSIVVALVLSPALAATLLRRPDPDQHASGSSMIARLHRYGNRFNAWFTRTVERYVNAVAKVIARAGMAMLVYAGLVAVLAVLFFRLPTSFLPVEDQGGVIMQYSLPPGATMERTLAAASEIEQYFLQKEKNVSLTYTINGQAAGGGASQSAGRGFVQLIPWDERGGAENSAMAIAQRATQSLSSMRDVRFFAVSPPVVQGLGQSNGFTMELLNIGGLDHQEFKARRDQLLNAAQKDPLLAAVRLSELEDSPTLTVNIDQEKVGALGLSQSAVDATLSAAWGGVYVNDFVDRGRVKRVYVQGDAPYRSRPEDLGSWFVRGTDGAMAPFSAFASTAWSETPVILARFNGQSSFEFQGQAAPGRSSGDAMARMEELASKLPGTAIAWSGLSYQEQSSSSQTSYLYGLSLLVVFLCLAALYESWSVPLAAMLVIPLGLLGATLAITLRGLESDVYFQVGLLTTMGLSAKNAILIIEFAEQGERAGKTAYQAVIDAARLRIRPILMTSFAFIFGVLPLAIATGAGAHSRLAIGTAVIGGMVAATALAIFYVPLFYVLVRRYFKGRLHGMKAAA